jgi:hypothetical protein
VGNEQIDLKIVSNKIQDQNKITKIYIYIYNLYLYSNKENHKSEKKSSHTSRRKTLYIRKAGMGAHPQEVQGK